MTLPQRLAQFVRSYATRMGPPITKLGITNVQHIIAVASGKGGVGKSTSAGGFSSHCMNHMQLSPQCEKTPSTAVVRSLLSLHMQHGALHIHTCMQ